jgi:hypothetical protein
VPLESLPGHCDLLDSGHWQDMLTGKHDLLCKQLPPVWIKLRHDTSGHAAPRPCHIKLRPCRTTFRHCTQPAASTVSAARQKPSWVDTSCHCQRPPRHIQEQRAHQATQISALPCASPTRTSVHTAVAAAMQQCCLYFWTTLTTWLRIQAAFKAPSLGTGLSALLLGSTALSANVAASSAVAAGRVCALITITRCTAAAPGAP